MAEPIHRLTLGIPASLKPKLDALARSERRSLSKQIIVMLEKASDATSASASAGGATTAGLASQA